MTHHDVIKVSIKPRVKTLLIGETEIKLIQEARLDKHYQL